MNARDLVVRTEGFVSIRIPIRTWSENDLRRMHKQKLARTVANERAAVSLIMRTTLDARAYDGVELVKLYRNAPSRVDLDDDNLRGALKAVRDEVASFLGTTDGPKSRLRFEYGQRRQKEYEAVIVLVLA